MPTLAELEQKKIADFAAPKKSEFPPSSLLLKDENGVYHVHFFALQMQKQGTLSEAGERILSWHLSETQDLIVDVYCAEQVTISGKLRVNQLIIKAQGPIYLSDTIHCVQNLVVKAKSLAFQQTVYCGRALVIETEQGTGFEAGVDCKMSSIQAAAIYQFSPWIIEEHADFACTHFESHGLKTPLLRLVAQTANFYGLTEINGSDHRSMVHIERELHINEKALLQLRNVDVQLNSGFIEGVFNCVNTQLDGNSIVNVGCIDFCQGLFVIHETYTLNEGGKHYFENSQACIQQAFCADGQLSYQNSIILGNQHSILSGQIMINAETILCLEEFTLSDESEMCLTDSTIEGASINLSGTIESINTTIWAQSVVLNSDRARFTNLNLWTSDLNIFGACKPENRCFTNSVLNMSFSSSLLSQFTLKNSSLYLIGESFGSEQLRENVVLQNSNIVSGKQLQQPSNSRLLLEGNSYLIAPEITSAGEIVSEFSAVFARRLSQLQARLEAKNTDIYLSEQFIAKQSKIILANNAKCFASNILLQQTRVDLVDKSFLWAKNTLNHDQHSSLSALDSSIITGVMNSLGTVKLDGSLLSAQDALIHGHLDTINHSQIDVHGLIKTAKGSIISVRDARIKAKAMIAAGKLVLQEGGLLAVNGQLALMQDGLFVLEPGSMLMADHLAQFGQMNVCLLDKGAKSQAITSPAQLRVNKQFIINCRAQLTGDAPLIGHINNWFNFGSVKLSTQLMSCGSLFYNDGDFEAPHILLDYEQLMSNSGTLSSANLTVLGDFINPLGAIYAETISQTGCYNLNLGVICVNQYNSRNLVSGNFGLVLPNIYSDHESLFSTSSLLALGQRALTTLIPHYDNLINLAAIIPQVVGSVQSIYQGYQKCNLEKLRRMKRHEWISSFAQLHAFTSLGISSLTKASSIKTDGFFSGFPESRWIDVGLKAAYVYMGIYQQETNLLHLNSGLHLGGCISNTDVAYLNRGIEGSLYAAVDTHWFYNKGSIDGLDASVAASKMVNEGRLNGVSSLSIASNSLTNTELASVNGRHACIQTNVFDQKGSITLNGGVLFATTFDNTGSTSLSHMGVSIKQTHIANGTSLDLKDTTLTGTDLSSEGKLKLDTVSLVLDGSITWSKDAQESIHDVYIETKSLRDHSYLEQSGQLMLRAKEEYQHDGIMKSVHHDQSDLFYVESQKAQLDGQGNLDKAIYDLASFSDAEALLRGDGPYTQYQYSSLLGVKVKDAGINLTGTISRNCGILAEAKTINVVLDYATFHDLIFSSTEADVHLSGHLNADNVYGNAAGTLSNTAYITTKNTIHLNAKAAFQNLGGILNGDQVIIRAGSIWNRQGAIHGNKVFAEAKSGNLINEGGIFRAEQYAQLTAIEGDIINTYIPIYYWNGYSPVCNYLPGLIVGGTGTEETQGLGLYVQAGGIVDAKASNFISVGSNYIDGKKGIYLHEEKQTYISRQWTQRTWYGKKTIHREIVTQVNPCIVHSEKGANVLHTDEQFLSIATAFSASLGTQVEALGEVKLYSVKTSSRLDHSRQSWWGLKKTQHHVFKEDALPNLFCDEGDTIIISHQGSIHAGGALFIGSGNLSMQAANWIYFGCDKLRFISTDEHRRLNMSLPGSQAFSVWHNGGHWLDAVDGTIAHVHKLMNSANRWESLAGTFNLGIDLYNTSSDIMAGMAHGHLGKVLLARYGLGGAQGFAPMMTLSLAETKTVRTTETLATEGVEKNGNLQLIAGKGIELDEGVRVHANNIDIDTPQLIEKAASLHSSVEQTSKTASLSFNPQMFHGVGYSQVRTRMDENNFRNSELLSDGHLHLHYRNKEVERVELDGGTIKAETLDTNIQYLLIKDKQNTVICKNKAFSLNTNGDISFYKNHDESKKTIDHSGIYVTEEINAGGHSFHVHEAQMEGGVIISQQGKNNSAIDHLTTVILADERHSSGWGFHVNINDCYQNLSHQSQHQGGGKAIVYGSIRVDHSDYQATQTPVIHGQQGTDIAVGKLHGKLHTQSADGRTILKDHDAHLDIDVPIIPWPSISVGVKKAEWGSLPPSETIEEKKSNEIKKKSKLNKKDAESEEVQLLETVLSLDNAKLSKKINEESFNKKIQNLNDKLPVKEQLKKVIILSKIYRKKPTKENKKDLQQAIEQSVLAVMKEVSNNGFEAFKHVASSTSVSHSTSKIFVDSRILVINLLFNLLSAEKNPNIKKQDIIKETVSQTAADVTVGFGLRLAVGAAASYFSWGLVSFCVANHLFYDRKKSQQLLEHSITHHQEAQKFMSEGHYFLAFGMRDLAQKEMQLAGSLELVHEIAKMPDHVTDGFKWVWQKVETVSKYRFFHPKSEIAKEQQKPSDKTLGF